LATREDRGLRVDELGCTAFDAEVERGGQGADVFDEMFARARELLHRWVTVSHVPVGRTYCGGGDRRGGEGSVFVAAGETVDAGDTEHGRHLLCEPGEIGGVERGVVEVVDDDREGVAAVAVEILQQRVGHDA
jgi:hypothetical protein